jgi:CyaY protein
VDEQQFRTEADRALDSLYKRLAHASEDADFEADFNAGTLAIEFDEPPAKFVVSPNSPVRQIWVSAQSRSFKLQWDPERRAFVLPESGESLTELIQHAISQHLGEEITL